MVWPDGTEEIRAGGTQKCDGFFAGLRDAVGRSSLNTERWEQLQVRVRFFQWKYENFGSDLFQVLWGIVSAG